MLMISLICVPIMLIPKPLILWIKSLNHAIETDLHPHPHNEIANTQEELTRKLKETFDEKEDN